MNTLFETYGYCKIPKNTLLFRGFTDGKYDDCMFFGTKYFLAKAFNTNVQVWKTKKTITVLFLVKYLNNRGFVISGIPDLYNTIMPHTNITDLEIKQDITIRKPFISTVMQDYTIHGWVTSVEDKIEVEICLFDLNFCKENLELIESSINQDSKYIKDSLKKITICPAESFYEKTNQNLKSNYSAHKKAIQSWIKDEAKTQNEKETLQHYCFDLRLKLKI